MKEELSQGHLHFSTQQKGDGEELSIVTKLILTDAIPLELIASVSDLPIEELEKIKKDLTPPT